MKSKESIEIPFGAKDSKLKGWEYTIPEGMEAEIQDGKIIVREKESDDERIRQWCVNLIKATCDYDSPTSRKEVDDAIAWLEKQGSQNPEDKDRYMEGYMNGMNDALKEQNLEKENTGIGLCEYDAGHENGRMELIDTLKKKLSEI